MRSVLAFAKKRESMAPCWPIPKVCSEFTTLFPIKFFVHRSNCAYTAKVEDLVECGVKKLVAKQLLKVLRV